MPAIIESIEKNSIADDLGLKKGDEVLFINGKKLQDYLDYKFYAVQEELDLHIKYQNGEEQMFEIEKDFGEDLGINFENVIFDKIKPCANNCAFCFVDQQPSTMRDTLLIKDDDYRLSFFNGTYITFTNLNKKDRERIETLRIGPLYVSVHTTDGELRSRLLNNKMAKNIKNDLAWLEKLEIPIHTQIVLCPDINDGEALKQTLKDLSSYSNVLSIAIVPVGVTKFQNNPIIKKVTKENAKNILDMAYEINNKLQENLVTPSDEFFILAEENFPQADFYRDYGQLEDGVGVSRMLKDDFDNKKHLLPKKIKEKTRLLFFTGKLAEKTIKHITKHLNQIENLEITLHIGKSNFWGEDVTVAGLFTGKDILDELSKIKNLPQTTVIPSVMLKDGSNIFLDDITIKELEKKLHTNFFVIKDPYCADEFIELVNSLSNTK